MFLKLLEKKGFTLKESSWILYDVANSAQTLTTMTVLFPLLIDLKFVKSYINSLLAILSAG